MICSAIVTAVVVMVTCIAVQGYTSNASMGGPKCIDCPTIYRGFLDCDELSCDWLLSNGYWAGNITEGGEPILAECPYGYCLNNDSEQRVRIPHSFVDRIGDFLCNQSYRVGIVCSQCQPGYAPAINTAIAECVPCDSQRSKVNWIFYLLAVYLPLLVVFIFIIVFDVRLTSGPLNSFIIFAQVISTTIDIGQQNLAPLNTVYGSGTDAFRKSYGIPYDFFNLNLVGNVLPPFCLHETLETLDVIALRYIVALFPLVIIVTMVLLVRCKGRIEMTVKLPSCLKRYRAGASMVQVFAAFVLLSYNRLCEITFYLLSFNPLFDYTLKTQQQRNFYQAIYSFDDPTYSLRYKLPAYVMLVILVIVPISLLHYPVKWLERMILHFDWSRRFYPSARIAILLDTFQGCFKDNRRYFAGLYLALRLFLFGAFVQPFLQQLLIQQVLFIGYIVLIFMLKPYKNKRLNYIDVLIFGNLALINSLTWFAVNQIEPDVQTIFFCIVVESILVFLPMVYFIAYLISQYTKQCSFMGEATKRCCYISKRTFQGRKQPIGVTSAADKSTFYISFDNENKVVDVSYLKSGV